MDIRTADLELSWTNFGAEFLSFGEDGTPVSLPVSPA
jgi:hypothetical protein